MTRKPTQRKPKQREKIYRHAIEWALGVRGEFPSRGEFDGTYWWRRELQKRAGLKWDGKKFEDLS